MNILIADDIFSNQLLIKSILENVGYECKVVSNGKKLIKEFEKADYDIILTDIEMPVMNGFETVKYIREKFDWPKNKIPVIALTAHNMREFADKIEGSGFSDIISKPYSIEKFKAVIEKYIN